MLLGSHARSSTEQNENKHNVARDLLQTCPMVNRKGQSNSSHSHVTHTHIFPRNAQNPENACAGSAPPSPRRPVLPTALEHAGTLFNPAVHSDLSPCSAHDLMSSKGNYIQ